MKRARILIAASIGVSLGLAGASEAFAAADCGEPVPAPKWEIGDTWTHQDESGQETTQTVVSVEPDRLVRVESGRTLRKSTLVFDGNLVLREVMLPDGTFVRQPGQTTWVFLGLKTLDFPLATGKTWSFQYVYDLQTFRRIYRVVACEEATAAAGRFFALKLEALTRRLDGRWQGMHHEWYAPAAKWIVRQIFQRPNYPETVLDGELLRYWVK